MSDDATINPTTLIELTAHIVGAYVERNAVPPLDLPDLIGAVHATLTSLGTPKAPAQLVEPLMPAVNPRRSVFATHIVSLIDGKPYKALKRHIGRHSYTPESYRAAYGLPADYPMTCSDYSAARSGLAKTMGLGRKAPANQMAA